MPETHVPAPDAARTGSVVTPVARSPITVSGPSAVVDGWQLSTRRSGAALRLTDASRLAKVSVRAGADGPMAAALGVAFRGSRHWDGALIIGSGPGEWLIVGAQGTAGAIAEKVRGLGDGGFVTAVDLTHGRAMMRLTGRDGARALSKVCAVDLSDAVTPDGAAFRTSVAKVATDVARDDEAGETGESSYLVHCERSSGQYLYECLLDAGREFGIEPAG